MNTAQLSVGGLVSRRKSPKVDCMGFRGLSPKQISRMMKKMGIEQEDLTGVKEVIIRFADKEWFIPDAHVSMIKQPGAESYQVSGTRKERALTSDSGTKDAVKTTQRKTVEIPIQDAALVASQTGVTVDVAMSVLKETDGDLAAAILKLRRG